VGLQGGGSLGGGFTRIFKGFRPGRGARNSGSPIRNSGLKLREKKQKKGEKEKEKNLRESDSKVRREKSERRKKFTLSKSTVEGGRKSWITQEKTVKEHLGELQGTR